jgi:hypothetical protein
MTRKFSQCWISVSITLFVVAFALLALIMRTDKPGQVVKSRYPPI